MDRLKENQIAIQKQLEAKMKEKTDDRYKGKDFDKFHRNEFDPLKQEVEQLKSQIEGTR